MGILKKLLIFILISAIIYTTFKEGCTDVMECD